jgi:ionotropic kainate glutamate receptor 2
MNDYKYHYHLTTFDIEVHDLENMAYNFVNLTAYRIVDSSNAIVRHVLRDIERFSPKGKSILNKTNVIQV